MSEPKTHANQSTERYGYNMAAIFVELQAQVSERLEQKISDSLLSLSQLNDQNRALQQLLTHLTLASKNTHEQEKDKDKKGVDFSKDEEVKRIIDQVHSFAPELFGHVNFDKGEHYLWKSDHDIQATLQVIDNRVKMHVTEINKLTMFINQDYEDRIQYTDSAQKTLEMMTRHIDAIISKYNKHS